MDKHAEKIATLLEIKIQQADAAITLLNEGASVPFIARYRKELTGSLDDSQLRQLEEKLGYLRELDERRDAILSSIKEQEKLTPALEKQILAVESKAELEDIYLPYKPKRQTKAQIARQAGLAPLAEAIMASPASDPTELAAKFINPDNEIKEVKDALDGARQILMEDFSESAELIKALREYCQQHAEIKTSVVDESNADAAKFKDYFDYQEAIKNIPSHRALAILRGRRENHLRLKVFLPEVEATEAGSFNPCEQMIIEAFPITDDSGQTNDWLKETIRWTWKIKIFTRLELELLSEMRERADIDAIDVFAKNLKDLLLAAPAGHKTTLGLDPGIRTGTKVAIVDQTGKVLEHTTIYPLQPKNQWDQSIATLAALCEKHNVELISIGNGTGSRETDKLVQELIKKHQLKLQKLVVNEAGASVYSASELAANEFPDLDVTIRGAVSIARRLQDPLAELVKIEPKSIGVGQYQHDVNQVKLARSLVCVVEDCVNAVGVDVNTASVPLLKRVSGISQTLADNIVKYRDQNGAFADRQALMQVPMMGKKAFEQSAGFLRITNGSNPLDASAVHPESYPVVEKIVSSLKLTVNNIIGNAAITRKLKPREFTDEHFGEPTVVDIIQELEKPGRDPRPEFKTATFKEGVEDIKDVKVGMQFEGVVTNVTNFGAFVDIGVHQDGLVHISELANRYVADPREIVKSGECVHVRVISIDLDRRRIQLSMKAQGQQASTPAPSDNKTRAKGKASKPGAAMARENPFADKLSAALQNRGN